MSARKSMSADARKVLFDKLFERDREFVGGTWRVRCSFCGRWVSRDRKQTLIDHKDNEPSNNKSENLQLIHRRCNYLKNPRGKKPLEREQQPGDDDQVSGELRKNRLAEPAFTKWLLDYVRTNGPKEKETLINAGAFVANISTITATRYMRKLSSLEGPLMVYHDHEAGQDLVKFRQGRHANDEISV